MLFNPSYCALVPVFSALIPLQASRRKGRGSLHSSPSPHPFTFTELGVLQVLIHAFSERLLGTYNIPGSILGSGTQQQTRQMQSVIVELTMVLTQGLLSFLLGCTHLTDVRQQGGEEQGL